jgi:hypothetical protein
MSNKVIPELQEGSRAWCQQLTYEILQNYAKTYYGRKPKETVEKSVRTYFGDKVYYILVGLITTNVSGWYDKNFDEGCGVNITTNLRDRIKKEAREAIHKQKIIFEKISLFGLVKKLRLIDNYEDILVDNDVIETVLNNAVHRVKTSK